MTRRDRAAPSAWQKQVLAELRAMAKERPDELRVIEDVQIASRDAVLRLQLSTSGIPRSPGGLQLRSHEEFILCVQPSSFLPPTVEVDHARFVGHPHVLQGQRLCVYLDPSREWQPALGAAGFLNRLSEWLTDAAAGAFDASTALYHAVGGVLHRTAGTPTIVVREAGPMRPRQAACLVERSAHRYDLTYATDRDGHRLPVFSLATGLPFGASLSVATFLRLLDDPYLDRAEGRPPRVLPQSPAFLTSLLASAARNSDGAAQYFVLAVPYPGGAAHHLVGGRLSAVTADALRNIAGRHGTTVNIDPEAINADIPIEWCTMSDERQAVTTRRDEARPVNGFRGRAVHIWGCGGLGSWLAEFIARAGAAALTVCDPGNITGGLLVRQNYVEDDIGRTKAEALARRLRTIRDELTVTVVNGSVPDDPALLATTDLVIDATVSNAITSYLDTFTATGDCKAVLAQVATDARSGSLGMVNIWAPEATATPSEIDRRAGLLVSADGELELYHSLWQEVEVGDEIIPTRGCSIPTFHGSAADLAAVAATLANLIGMHLQQTEGVMAGTHLIALPHAAAGPRHHFVPAETAGAA